MSVSTGILVRRLRVFLSLARKTDRASDVVTRGGGGRGRGILSLAVSRLSLSIHDFGYLGHTNVGAIRSLAGGSRRSVVGIEGLNHGSLRRIVTGLGSFNFALGGSSRWELSLYGR